MFEIFLLIILLPASLIANFFLVRRGLRFVKENEKLNDTIDDFDNQKLIILEKLESMLIDMREIDNRGAFEADDEVGVSFKEMIQLIEDYKNEI